MYLRKLYILLMLYLTVSYFHHLSGGYKFLISNIYSSTCLSIEYFERNSRESLIFSFNNKSNIKKIISTSIAFKESNTSYKSSYFSQIQFILYL